MKVYRGLLIFTAAYFSAVALLGVLFRQYYAALLMLAIGLILTAVLMLWLRSIHNKQDQLMNRVFRENDGAVSDLIENISIPSLILDETGTVAWSNRAFKTISESRDIREVIPAFDSRNALNTMHIEHGGKNYQIMNMALQRGGTRKLVFQYWLDRTEAAHYQRLYTEQRPYVALLYVDNYEDLISDAQIHSTAVLAEVERIITDLVKRLGGVYRRFENGRFILVLEAKQVEVLEQEKFQLLDQVHRIDTGTSASVSVSISVGVADRLFRSEQDARQAMELALGRGGDQVVVKDGVDYRFYGGKRQQDARQSRVKARLFSKALMQLFENSGDVFIMGHRNPDMDCIGAALGIMTCANHVGRHAYIVLDGSNTTIEDALNHLERAGEADCLITPERAMEMLQSNSVLVVVDTQRASNTVAPALLNNCERIVLIDHHRRNADHIENATLHYLESRSSSASEMVTEIMQYFADNVRPASFTCSALLAGITVDTKQFAFNVGSRTFDAAGYLRRNGADLSSVKLMFQNDFENYVRCSNIVEQAKIRPGGIAVSHGEKDQPDGKLLAAQAADELLGIRGIQAAFVLGQEGDTVFISGRSYGQVNVQLILEQLGGGGHLTMAGAQLNGVTIAEATELLEKHIEQYEQDNLEERKG